MNNLVHCFNYGWGWEHRMCTSSLDSSVFCFFFNSVFLAIYDAWIQAYDMVRSWILYAVCLGQVSPVLAEEESPLSDSELSIGLFVGWLIVFSVCSELYVKWTCGQTGLKDTAGFELYAGFGRLGSRLLVRCWKSLQAIVVKVQGFGNNGFQGAWRCCRIVTEKLFDRCQNRGKREKRESTQRGKICFFALNSTVWREDWS